MRTEKACGDDNIINEYIQSSAHLLIPIYVKLLNSIFDSGKVPDTWSMNAQNIFFFFKVKSSNNEYKENIFVIC
jgi:hypothetical protein